MFLSLDKPGVFPSQKYFFEKGASRKEKFVLFVYFIKTNQFQTKIMQNIYERFEKNHSLSDKELKVVLNRVEETFNSHTASITHLFKFPSLTEFQDIQGFCYENIFKLYK